jgi:hypothetical protein
MTVVVIILDGQSRHINLLSVIIHNLPFVFYLCVLGNFDLIK